MGKSSRKSINRTSNQPARRAQRDAAATTSAEPAVTAATAEPAPPTASVETPAAAEAPRHQVAQLAFHYFTESGFAHGNALDHWLRAETELGRRS